MGSNQGIDPLMHLRRLPSGRWQATVKHPLGADMLVRQFKTQDMNALADIVQNRTKEFQPLSVRYRIAAEALRYLADAGYPVAEMVERDDIGECPSPCSHPIHLRPPETLNDV